ncbi:hypothetical protein BKA67DRAFT_583155 [Truncatella angustata]|uniref:Uncharacterized protein n=1 Tax=Truncatella angustata TaxID=152316 RepID=A0A9P8U9A3_9PEZI|nr:uncharacterized protein BKA67DRAFT_583155 [Truncatella angustata]KAH6646084.1 hypothetical protein BKA67DRAFT_583155 [Truncatella angustata]
MRRQHLPLIVAHRISSAFAEISTGLSKTLSGPLVRGIANERAYPEQRAGYTTNMLRPLEKNLHRSQTLSERFSTLIEVHQFPPSCFRAKRRRISVVAMSMLPRSFHGLAFSSLLMRAHV